MSRGRRFRVSDEKVLEFLKSRTLTNGFTAEDLARMHPERHDMSDRRRAVWWARERIKLLRAKNLIVAEEYPGYDKRRVIYKVVEK